MKSPRERLADILARRAKTLDNTARHDRAEGAGDAARAAERLAVSLRRQAAELRDGGAK